MKKTMFGMVTLTAVNVFLVCMLGFQQTTSQAQQSGRQPFANSVGQRQEMIEQLKETNRLLKEQNALLKSGSLRVIVVKQKG